MISNKVLVLNLLDKELKATELERVNVTRKTFDTEFARLWDRGKRATRRDPNVDSFFIA